MSVIKTALVAASFVVVAAAANAQSREDLNSRIHGEPAVSQSQSYNVAPRAAYTQNARGAYARAYTNYVRPQLQQYEANPLFDDFHGN
ncbi:hypothetical protein [Pseudorhodoplanes sinuspersici]|uniref:Uncharacterized protein n=1 Tax=Pseudorhodoplanes sinuspersici TaxID=1235591 RepID=A0A1W6ZKI1_9HYPH|nr:hypothetical protein [Pseudorhodoplanes sinuspersici]ARP97757.1 hypothetical protein CAK95_00685 [Pseudorhodoplanes sinuspersici]RKE68518.1 hypothetical protein DFP91_4908 [Pseudorhodoplanes sinuspersici]